MEYNIGRSFLSNRSHEIQRIALGMSGHRGVRRPYNASFHHRPLENAHEFRAWVEVSATMHRSRPTLEDGGRYRRDHISTPPTSTQSERVEEDMCDSHTMAGATSGEMNKLTAS